MERVAVNSATVGWLKAWQNRVIWLPRFHAEWIAQNLPGAQLHRVPNAWHFTFMDTPSMAIPTKDGDLGADPPGFDRSAFLKRLSRDLPAFFDKAFQ